MTLTEEKVLELKNDFPLLSNQKVVYLDNAATTQKPRQVLAAMDEFYKNENANVHRGIYRLSANATERFEQSRATVAAFVNARPDEVVFTKNTTEALNLLSYSLPSLFDGKDEIVLTQMEHHSNIVPWQQAAKRHGLKLRFIRLKDLSLDYGHADELITEKTALVSFCQVSNALGTINDAKKLVQLAKEAGAYSIVDAAQSAPFMPVDVQNLGCDFLAFSGHKMFGPGGIGALYGKREILERLPPFLFGGDMISRVTMDSAEWNEVPFKFEAGTPNVAGAIGFAEAVRYLQKVGMPAIEAWERKLLAYTYEHDLTHLDLFSSKQGAGIFSFNIRGIHPHDVASILDKRNVCVRAGHHCAMPLMETLGVPGTCRASFSLYNTRADIDALFAGIDHAKGLFKVMGHG
ncbi:MAG: cysteine desulfurase [Nanoarchaeota archaeon]